MSNHEAQTTRRTFLGQIAGAASVSLLAPYAVACGGSPSGPVAAPSAGGESATPTIDPLAVPVLRPDGWDPLAFNRARGNAGAIPDSYLPSINGDDGDEQHLGKHLPYVPALAPSAVPRGMLAIMWGDPAKGHAPHPNAPPSDENPEGHWYDWIRVRKATNDAQEVESRFSGWPETAASDSGAYAPFEGEEVTDDAGKNTVYLVQLPADVEPGDLIRIHAHCLTHGEYVDFLTVPA